MINSMPQKQLKINFKENLLFFYEILTRRNCVIYKEYRFLLEKFSRCSTKVIEILHIIFLQNFTIW